MSVVVNTMNMPIECEYCGFCRFYRENGRVWCNAKNRILKYKWDNPDFTYLNVKRPDWCPLIELPSEHGRLIDADRLKDVLEKNFGHTCGAAVLAQLIDVAPTVLEKEKENEFYS